MRHIHRYERAILGKNNYVVYKCNLPDCNHYISEKLIKGKRSLCNRCGDQMIMDSRAMKLVKPHCINCIAIRKKPEHDKLLEFVEKIS